MRCVPLRIGALALYAMLCGVAPAPTATPTVYNPAAAEALHPTLSSGVYAAAAGTGETGEPIDGFALSLTANRYTLPIGDSLWFAVELRNVSGAPKSTDLSSKDTSYAFSVRDTRTGITITQNAAPGFGPPTAYKYAPNTSLYLWFLHEITDNILQTASDHILEPGIYTIQVTVTSAGHALRSNVVTLDVLPSRNGRPSFGLSDPSSRAPSGAPVAGTALSLAAPVPPYRVGSPIWIDTELRNLTSDSIAVSRLFGSSYDIKVLDLSTGRALQPYPVQPLDGFAGPFGEYAIPKGQSHFEGLRLDRFFPIQTVGTYSIQVSVTTSVWCSSCSPWPPPTTIVLRSNVVRLKVLPPRPGAAPTGLTFSLTTSSPKTNLGAPVLVTVELRNVSGDTQDALFGSRSADYDFIIVNQRTGQVVRRNPNAVVQGDVGGKPSSRAPVYPETSLYASFELNGLYRFTQAGTYTIRVTGQPTINGARVTLESNPVEVTLATPAPPPPTLALPETNRVLSFKIQTNRPVYTSGEPILVRLVVTNYGKEPVAYNPFLSQLPGIISVVNARNKPVPIGRGGPVTILRGSMMWPSLAPGATRLGWSDIGTWGYHLAEPGTYTISVRPEIYGRIFTPSATYALTSDNAKGAPPVRVQILTKAAARTEPAYSLDDPNLDARFRSLMREYGHLRSGARDFITHLQSGARQNDLFLKSGNWQTEQRDFDRRIDALPSSGNVDSPYVLLNANLWSAASALGAVANSALYSCDPASAGANLKVADYFVDAVRRELSAGETNAGDAAYPPSESSPKGRCTR